MRKRVIALSVVDLTGRLHAHRACAIEFRGIERYWIAVACKERHCSPEPKPW